MRNKDLLKRVRSRSTVLTFKRVFTRSILMFMTLKVLMLMSCEDFQSYLNNMCLYIETLNRLLDGMIVQWFLKMCRANMYVPMPVLLRMPVRLHV